MKYSVMITDHEMGVTIYDHVEADSPEEAVEQVIETNEATSYTVELVLEGWHSDVR